MKVILLFLVIFIIIAINLPTGMIAGMGFEPNILIAALIAIVFTSFIKEEHFGLVILVVTMTVLANFPVEDFVEWGYDRDIIIASLIVLVFSPLIYRIFD